MLSNSVGGTTEPSIVDSCNPAQVQPYRKIQCQDGNCSNVPAPLFSTMWKIRPQPRIKPVIARDTTCSVSLLTGTTSGSNFAIPSTKIPAHGNGTEFPAVPSSTRSRSTSCGPCPARGDSARSAGAGKRLRRPGRIRKSGRPEADSKAVNPSRVPEVKSRKPEARRSAVAVPRPSPGARQKLRVEVQRHSFSGFRKPIPVSRRPRFQKHVSGAPEWKA